MSNSIELVGVPKTKIIRWLASEGMSVGEIVEAVPGLSKQTVYCVQSADRRKKTLLGATKNVRSKAKAKGNRSRPLRK